MKISKEQFTKLAKEHLIALESYKMDENGNKPIEIFGIEKLYEAINVIHCCKSDIELLPKRLSNEAYKCARTMDYNGFVNWWDKQV